jgi:transposase
MSHFSTILDNSVHDDFAMDAHAPEQLRLLAMLRVADGCSQQFVADFLGVSRRTIGRWRRRFRCEGEAGLLPRQRSGRPPKLNEPQVEQVLSWVDRSACEFGFTTDRWTAPRVASLIERVMGVRLNHRYLSDWLARHGITPQMPQRQPRERNQELIDAWVRHQWPRIKKNRATCTPPLVLRMKAGSCWPR